MHSPSLPTSTTIRKAPPRARRSRPAAEQLPAHLNFSFSDWIKQRTEPSRQPTGWTPLSLLHADYRTWCEATDVPAGYILAEAEFSGRLRAHSDREPETRPVERRGMFETVVDRTYELCFPRFLKPAVRVPA